jgi:hypothetical protein
MKKISTIFCLFCAGFALAQSSLPANKVYLFDYTLFGDGEIRIENPTFITADLPSAHYSDPYFDGDRLYFSISEDRKQSDIWVYDLGAKTRERLTWTNDASETHPQIVPNQLQTLMCLTKKGDKNNLQTLPTKGGETPKNAKYSFDDISNFLWLDISRLLISTETEGTTQIMLYRPATEEQERISSQTATGLGVLPNGNPLFVYKRNSAEWQIMQSNRITNRNNFVIGGLLGCEEITGLSDGSIIQGRNARIFRFVPQKDKNWLVAADFKDLGITNIQKVVVGKNKIAVITQ